MATLRQRKTATILLENAGKMSVSMAMKKAGYPASTAKNPQQLTKSKSWDILMEEYIPEEKLARLHNEQLEAKKIQFRDNKRIEFPDNDARLRALDYGYKIRGMYPKEQIEVSFIARYKGLTDGELKDIAGVQ
jgi:hypothetical protein